MSASALTWHVTKSCNWCVCFHVEPYIFSQWGSERKWSCKNVNRSHQSFGSNPPTASYVTVIQCPTFILTYKAPYNLASWYLSDCIPWSLPGPSYRSTHTSISAAPQKSWTSRPVHFLSLYFTHLSPVFAQISPTWRELLSQSDGLL